MATIVGSTTQSLSSVTSGTAVDISAADNLSVQIDGTFVATWAFQVSLDGTFWQNFGMHSTSNATATNDVTSATVVGFFIKPCTGIKYFRPTLTAYTSGTVNFRINETMLEK
jgi:hypothetical protein